MWLPIILGYSAWNITIPTSLFLRTRHYDRVPQGEEFERFPMETPPPQGHAGPGSHNDIDGQHQHETKAHQESYTKHWLALIRTFVDDATWAEGDARAFYMSGVNISFVLDELNTVIGPTGSGKTSLLPALSGEMGLLGGNINCPGEPRLKTPASGPLVMTESVAYSAQQAWLINDSIKQNILFGSPWDPERYSVVVATCALKADLHVLPAGDNTMIGEIGIKLSGEQKQRVTLARAVYSKARYMLLDDC